MCVFQMVPIKKHFTSCQKSPEKGGMLLSCEFQLSLRYNFNPFPCSEMHIAQAGQEENIMISSYLDYDTIGHT